MRRFKAYVGLLSIAGILLVIGLLMTIHTVRHLPPQLGRLERKIEDIHTLRVYQQELVKAGHAVRRFEDLPSTTPLPLNVILRDVLPEADAEVRQRETTPVLDGWLLRRADTTFGDVDLSDVARFIERAETRRPPWRLQECNIVASERGAGMGRVTLVLEALEQETANP